jgi:signal peptidase I
LGIKTGSPGIASTQLSLFKNTAKYLMQNTWRLPLLFNNLILIVCMVVLWLLFAPTHLGGQVSYVIVNGNSMEPGFHLGDLTIMRKATRYQVGDVVTYRDAEMQAYVIHRIIGVEQGHFVLKGDNNSWIDSYNPTEEEILGKLWLHLPKLGNAFKWLRSPLHMALTIVLLGGILMAGMVKPSSQGKRKTSPASNPGVGLEMGLYVFGLLSLAFLGLSIFSFLRPLTRNSDTIQYQQESQFSYSATGAPVIYDTETVRSGEPIFPRLTCFLNIGFTYTLTGPALQDVSGNYQLVARVLDEQSGWQRTIPMNQQAPFQGTSFTATSTLDLCEILALIDILKEETGLRANNFTLEIIPQVVMTGIAGGQPIRDSFEPRLAFRFDDVHFSLTTPKGQADPLYSSQQNEVENLNVEPNTLALPGWEPTVGLVRIIALIGLALSASGLTIVGFRMFVTAQQSQEALIRMRYGPLLVNVYERNLAPTTAVIDVTTIDELAKLAERHNTVILHMAVDFMDCYLVQCNGITYRYAYRARGRNTAETAPSRGGILSYTTDDHGHSVVTMDLREDELFGYAIEKNRPARANATDTILLEKLKR